MIVEVQNMKSTIIAADARIMPLSLKLASDGCCQLTDDQKKSVAWHLREARGPANITMTEAELWVQMVGSVVSSYRPGCDDIAYK